jgi:hypothetical protein
MSTPGTEAATFDALVDVGGGRPFRAIPPCCRPGDAENAALPSPTVTP